MKHEKTWRIRAEYVRWAALLSPDLWTTIPLNHCWIDGHSAYSIQGRFSKVNGKMVELELANGDPLEVALAMLGPEERRRVHYYLTGGDRTPPPHQAACA